MPQLQTIFCTGGNGFCDNMLRCSAGSFTDVSIQGMFKNYGWAVTPAWGTLGWDGWSFCPEHLDDALELAYSEDH